MPDTQPQDFSTWLVNAHEQAVLIADDPSAYEELGLKLTDKLSERIPGILP